MRPHSSASNLANGIVALSEASTLDGPWVHPNLMAQPSCTANELVGREIDQGSWLILAVPPVRQQ